jgi:hypothetical protein
MGWFDRGRSSEQMQDASLEMLVNIIDGVLKQGKWTSGQTWTMPKPDNWEGIREDVRRQLTAVGNQHHDVVLDLTVSHKEVSITARDTSPEAGFVSLRDRAQEVQRMLSRGDKPDESGLSVYFHSLFTGYLRHEAVKGRFGRTTGWNVYFVNEMNNVGEAFIDRRGRRTDRR